MRRLMLVAVAALFASCAAKQPLVVKQFTLRDAKTDYGEDPMIRGEKLRHLYGAVSLGEQAQRLGQYYTILWNDASTGSPAKVIFEYQQGGSGSLVKRHTETFDPSATSGQTEFSVIGDNYTKNGRVLAWRARFLRGDREIASRRSYLWQ